MGYYQGLLLISAINAVVALGVYWSMLTGQVSIGHGGLMAVGAYVSSAVTVKLGMPLLIGISVGTFAAAVIGTALGIIVLRLHHMYLAMATLAFGELAIVYFRTSDFFGGAAGFGGMTGTSVTDTLIILILILALSHVIQHSRLGTAIRAIGIDDEAAEMIGIPTTRLKVVVFGFGAAITGLGGGLYAHYASFISPEMFDFQESILLVMMVVLGGATTYWGAVLGAVIFSLLPEALIPLGLGKWRMVIYGVVIVILLIIRPGGILGRSSIFTGLKNALIPLKQGSNNAHENIGSEGENT